MNNDPRVPYRILEEGENQVQSPKVVQLEALRMDPPVPVTGFRQHPQPHPQMRRLGTFDQPMPPAGTPYGYSDPAQQMGHYGHYDPSAYQAPGTHVNVNNNGQFYRPVKEELTLSFVKTIGNFFAWPIRLVGGFIEGIVQGAVGILKGLLLMIVAPMMLMTGYSYYQANQDKPATEIAADLGSRGVHLVGAMLGGIWDGITGDDEPEAENATAPAK